MGCEVNIVKEKFTGEDKFNFMLHWLDILVIVRTYSVIHHNRQLWNEVPQTYMAPVCESTHLRYLEPDLSSLYC